MMIQERVLSALPLDSWVVVYDPYEKSTIIDGAFGGILGDKFYVEGEEYQLQAVTRLDFDFTGVTSNTIYYDENGEE